MTEIQQELLNDDELQAVSGGLMFANDEIRTKTHFEYIHRFKGKLRRNIYREISRCLFFDEGNVNKDGAFAAIEANKLVISIKTYSELIDFINSINLV